MRKLIEQAFPIKKGAPKLNIRRVGYGDQCEPDKIGWLTDLHEQEQEEPKKVYSAIVILGQGVRESFEKMNLPFQRAIHSLQWRIIRAGFARSGFSHEIPHLSVTRNQRTDGLFHLNGENLVGQCLFHGNMKIAEKAYFDPQGRLCAIVGPPHFSPYFINPNRLKDAPVVASLEEQEQRKVITALDALIAHGYPDNHQKDWMAEDIVPPLVKDVVRRVFPH